MVVASGVITAITSCPLWPVLLLLFSVSFWLEVIVTMIDWWYFIYTFTEMRFQPCMRVRLHLMLYAERSRLLFLRDLIWNCCRLHLARLPFRCFWKPASMSWPWINQGGWKHWREQGRTPSGFSIISRLPTELRDLIFQNYFADEPSPSSFKPLGQFTHESPFVYGPLKPFKHVVESLYSEAIINFYKESTYYLRTDTYQHFNNYHFGKTLPSLRHLRVSIP